MAYKNDDDRRAYHQQYMRERRQWLKENHFCVECKKQDALTLAGKIRCFRCNEQHNFHNNKSRYKKKRKRNKKAQRLRAYRRNNHLCTQCGTPLAENYTFLMCPKCRGKNRVRQMGRLSQIPRQHWKDYGLCYLCGNKLDGAIRTDGEPSRLCRQCYQKACASLEKKRQNLDRTAPHMPWNREFRLRMAYRNRYRQKPKLSKEFNYVPTIA